MDEQLNLLFHEKYGLKCRHCQWNSEKFRVQLLNIGEPSVALNSKFSSDSFTTNNSGKNKIINYSLVCDLYFIDLFSINRLEHVGFM
jgi:hypothetical protein